MSRRHAEPTPVSVLAEPLRPRREYEDAGTCRRSFRGFANRYGQGCLDPCPGLDCSQEDAGTAPLASALAECAVVTEHSTHLVDPCNSLPGLPSLDLGRLVWTVCAYPRDGTAIAESAGLYWQCYYGVPGPPYPCVHNPFAPRRVSHQALLPAAADTNVSDTPSSPGQRNPVPTWLPGSMVSKSLEPPSPRHACL